MGDAFLETTPKAQSMKEIKENLDFIKIKNFCSAKDNVERMKRPATNREEIHVKGTSDKRLLSKIYN